MQHEILNALSQGFLLGVSLFGAAMGFFAAGLVVFGVVVYLPLLWRKLKSRRG